jgi:hypothetical protein
MPHQEPSDGATKQKFDHVLQDYEILSIGIGSAAMAAAEATFKMANFLIEMMFIDAEDIASHRR